MCNQGGCIRNLIGYKGRKVQPKHLKRLSLILTALNVATHAGQMNMPGMRFLKLEGGRFSVWVDENYRVTFDFAHLSAIINGRAPVTPDMAVRMAA